MINTYETFMKNCCDWGLDKHMTNANHIMHNTMQAISDAFTDTLDEQMNLVQKSIKSHTEHMMNTEKANSNSMHYALQACNDLDQAIKNMSEIRSKLSGELLNIYNGHMSNYNDKMHSDSCDLGNKTKASK